MTTLPIRAAPEKSLAADGSVEMPAFTPAKKFESTSAAARTRLIPPPERICELVIAPFTTKLRITVAAVELSWIVAPDIAPPTWNSATDDPFSLPPKLLDVESCAIAPVTFADQPEAI